MHIDQQAQDVLVLYRNTRFTLPTIIALYMVQEDLTLAVDRISFLAAGQIQDARIQDVIGLYEAALDPDSRLVYDLRKRNLKNAVAQFGGFRKETRFSAAVRRLENAQAALKDALDFIDRMPTLADPALYTEAVAAQLNIQKFRLQAYQEAQRKKLEELREWEAIELKNGDFDFTYAPSPVPEYGPELIVPANNSLEENQPGPAHE